MSYELRIKPSAVKELRAIRKEARARVDDEGGTVTVVKIGHRRDVYR